MRGFARVENIDFVLAQLSRALPCQKTIANNKSPKEFLKIFEKN
jgi:hypothetical protein